MIALHSRGSVDVVLTWDDGANFQSALAIVLIREPGTGPSDRIGESRVTQGNPNREEIIATLPAGLYTVRVLYQRQTGRQESFTLIVRRPS